MKLDYAAEVHPLAKLFPQVTGKRFDDLVADIKQKGLINPIVTLNGVVIDGRTRLRACRLARVEPRALDFGELKLACTPEEYIWSSNIERRQLTADQRAAVVFEWEKVVKEQARERQKQAGAVGKLNPAEAVRTRTALAAKAQVTEHKIQQMQKVKKLMPKLVPQIAAGKMKLKDAAKKADSQRPKVVTKMRIVNPITVSQAVKETMDRLIADSQIVAVRVGNRPAYFAALADAVAKWCSKKSKAA